MNVPTDGSYHRKSGLWDALLDADMNVYYWTWTSDLYHRLDTYFKIVIAIAASGTVAAWHFWSDHPSLWKVLSAVAAIVSIIHPLICSSERLKATSGLVSCWKEISTRYELLWQQDECLSQPKSWKEFEAAKHREAKIDESRLPKSERRIMKAYQQVRKKRGI